MTTKPPISTLVLVGGLLGLAIICVSALSFASGSDPEVVIRFITASVVPTIGIIVTALVVNSKLEETKAAAAEAKEATAANASTLHTIKTNTNGALSSLLARNRELEDQIKQLKGTDNEGQ